jgi:hypothetical protein
VTAAGETGAEGEEELQSKSERARPRGRTLRGPRPWRRRRTPVADRVVGGGSAGSLPGPRPRSGLLQGRGPRRPPSSLRPAVGSRRRLSPLPSSRPMQGRSWPARPRSHPDLGRAVRGRLSPRAPSRARPGRGAAATNCNDTATSKLGGSHWHTQGPAHGWATSAASSRSTPRRKNVTYFNGRGVAFHHYDPCPPTRLSRLRSAGSGKPGRAALAHHPRQREGQRDLRERRRHLGASKQQVLLGLQEKEEDQGQVQA